MKKYMLLILMFIFLSSLGIGAEPEIDYVIKTLRGNLRVWGSQPNPIEIFMTGEDGNFMLKDGLINEIRQVKQFELLITGKIINNKLVPLKYNTTFDKNIEKADDAVIIGEVYYNGKELLLLTDDQYVIQIESGLNKDNQGKKVLVSGNYNKTGEYQGEISVIGYIVIHDKQNK